MRASTRVTVRNLAESLSVIDTVMYASLAKSPELQFARTLYSERGLCSALTRLPQS